MHAIPSLASLDFFDVQQALVLADRVLEQRPVATARCMVRSMHG
jgi:hypothetical protein